MLPDEVTDLRNAVFDFTNKVCQLGQQLIPNDPIHTTILSEKESLSLRPYCLAVIGEKPEHNKNILQRLIKEAIDIPLTQGVQCWRDSAYNAPEFNIPHLNEEDYHFFYAENNLSWDLLYTSSSQDKAVIEKMSLLDTLCDAIIVTFSYNQLDYTPTWDLVKKLPLLNLIFTINPDSEITEIDLKQAKSQLQELSKKYLQKSNISILLIRQESERENIVYNDLHSYIKRLHHFSSLRTRELSNLVKHTREYLSLQVKEELFSRKTSLKDEEKLIQSIENNFYDLKKLSINHAQTNMNNIIELSQELWIKTFSHASKKIGIFPNLVKLFKYDKYANEEESYLFKHLSKNIKERLMSNDDEFINSCESYWDYVKTLALENLQCDLGEFPKDSLIQATSLSRNKASLGLYKPLLHIRFFNVLNEEFIKARNHVYSIYILMLIFISLGSIIGFLDFYIVSTACYILAGGTFFLGIIILLLDRLHVSSIGRDTHQMFSQQMQKDMNETLIEISMDNYHSFRDKLTLVYSHLKISRDVVSPISSNFDHLLREGDSLNFRLN